MMLTWVQSTSQCKGENTKMPKLDRCCEVRETQQTPREWHSLEPWCPPDDMLLLLRELLLHITLEPAQQEGAQHTV